MSHAMKMNSGNSIRISRARVTTVAGAIAIALLVAAICLPARATRAATAPPSDPMTVAKEIVNQAIAILQDKSMPVAQKREKLRALVAGHFDFRAMARSSLGYHWRNLPEAKRQQFTQLFSSFIQDAYLSRISEYKGQHVRFVREVDQAPGYKEIDSQILQQGKDPISVKYMLEQQSGQWKVYDVTIENISITANYRNQFNRVINNQGFDTLISDLERKQKQLAASLATQ